MNKILQQYGLSPSAYSLEQFGSGLIHRTFAVKNGFGEEAFILQEVNHHVFTKPEDIAHNLTVLDNFRKQHHPEFFFPVPLPTLKGEAYAREGDRYYRLTSYVHKSHAVNSCTTAEEAYEAARQFGKFTAMLTGVRMDMLRYTIPGFHDLNWRWQQFQDAMATGDAGRLAKAGKEIEFLQSRYDIVEQFNAIKKDPEFKIRVTHHDTKISNVLLDENEKGICVIDLDTVMPGYFFSDLGDMFRTYLSKASEEEKDLSKIIIRGECYNAIVKGYLTFMGPELTSKEMDHFDYAGEFMIYMQALRFLTDFLNLDRYYGQSYEGHNLLRAQNQIALFAAF